LIEAVRAAAANGDLIRFVDDLRERAAKKDRRARWLLKRTYAGIETGQQRGKAKALATGLRPNV